MGKQRGNVLEGDYGIPRLDDLPISRQLYLAIRAMDAGSSAYDAARAVAATAEERPDWDMEEVRTIGEWRAELG